MRKAKLKYLVIGLILGLALSSSVAVAANTQTVTRQITYGVRINYNGQIMTFAEDMRPLVMGGRTFLSLRAVSDMFGYPVDFDSGTNTAFIGNRHAGVRTPLNVAAPHFDTGGRVHSGSTSVSTPDTVTMGGITYRNALNFRSSGWSTLGGGGSGGSRFTLHNLRSQHRVLSGYVGRVDGTIMANATLNFYGDGQLLQSFDLRANDMPIPISVFVECVSQLRIEFTFAATGVGSGFVDYALIAYLE